LATLDWADSSLASSYDVYLWLASAGARPGTPTANVSSSSYTVNPQVLSLSNYKWQVIAKNGIGTAEGPVWTFSTVDRLNISGTIDIQNTVGAGNPGTLVGVTQTIWWSHGFSVALNLNDNILILDTGGGNYINASGVISGNGEVRLQGPSLYITGSTGNTYTGTTTVTNSATLAKTSGNALLGTITLHASSSLLWSANHQISDASAVTLAPTAVLNLNGRADTIAKLALTDGASVQTGAGGVLTTAVLTMDGTVMGSGTYTAATHAFVTGTGSVVVTTGGGPAFDNWVGTDSGGKSLTGAAAAFGADPDRDELSNGIEFVLGGEPNPSNPGSYSAALLPTAVASGSNLVFAFTRRHEAGFLNPLVEFSNDLQGEWSPAVDPGNALIDVTSGSLADTVTVTIPRGSHKRMFARLKVALSAVAGRPAPRITTVPQGSTVVGGGDFTLTAAAGGTKDVSWQWYFNGRAIAGATGDSYAVTGANPAHEGDYHVVVSNAQGNSASSVAHIAISTTPGVAGLNLVPWPLNVQPGDGTLAFSNNSRIVATDELLLDAANVLATEIAAAYARTLPVVTTAAADGDIVLVLDASLTGERHTLGVDTRATVSGGNAFSVSMGTATLFQALRVESTALVCPRVTIDDHPAVAIRALHLDLARKDHSVESLLQAVDLCRLYKVNYLHLHFNDDQGYTFPSEAYPLLNTVTRNYGRIVYTLAEMHALESYAVARGVHIMPELEGPGHNHLMLEAYPALFKITYPITDIAQYEPSSSVNVAKPAVRAAWRTLIGEMCAVFQSTPYFHLGCDEVDWAWSEYSTDFQAAFAEWGFNRSNPRENVHLVFSKFISLARGYAAEYGKKSIVWENGAVTSSPEVPASTDVLVMPFDCWNPGAFVNDGLKLVNAAWSPLYVVDYAKKPVSEIYAWDRTEFGQFSGEKVDYAISHIAADQVAGTQLTTFEQEEDMEMMSVRARLAAMNERTWNPSLGTSYANFRSRLTCTDALLDAVLSPVRISYDGMDDPDDRVFSSNAIVSMSLAPGSTGLGLTIRYTTNRTNVTNTSTLYTGPFQLSTDGVLRAAAFNASGVRVGRMVRELYRNQMLTSPNLASNKPVTVSTGTNAARAVDLRLAEGWNTQVSDTRPDGETLTVDLESVQIIDRVAILFDPRGTCFYRVGVSLDNSTWTTVVDTSSAGIVVTRAGVTHTFTTVPARYVRLTLLPKAGYYDTDGNKTVCEFMVTGHATTYDGIDDPPAQKTAWVGRNVAFLTDSSTLDPGVMDKITTTFDSVFDYYAEATGQLPSPYLTYHDRSLVAEVDDSCGAGCGFLGATGVELAGGSFALLYDGVRVSNQYDQVLFYEFGRNFYFYDGKIRYLESGPMAAPAGESGWIGTGYAVLMRFASMDATGVKAAPFGSTPFATFRASVEGMVDTYTANAALNFQNTLLINQHPAGGGTTDFFASFCLRLAKWYGPQVLTRMWLEIGDRADAVTTQDAVDNWFMGCCYGAQRNLSTLFTSNWKIPLSDAAKTEALSRWGAAAATFP
jgi:hexosaminidase